jgi:hypothetical protein
MLNKYYVFRRLIDFVADHSEVTDADMNNYAGNIQIAGRDADGSTITIIVELKEEEKDA